MRVFKAVLGVVLLLAGVALAVAGINSVVTFGSDGTLDATSSRLETGPDSYALVADVVGVSAGFPGSSSLGKTTIGAHSANGERLFIGVGPRTKVDEYLVGVPFEAVRQDGSVWQSQPVPGTKKPADPTEEDVWTRQSTGNAPTVDFKAPDAGSSTFVIMNADGTPAVAAQMTIGYSSQYIFPLSIAAIVVGVLMALEGLYLLWRAGRKRTDDDEAPAPTVDPDIAGADLAEPSPLAGEADLVITDHQRQPDAEGVPNDWFREEDSSHR